MEDLLRYLPRDYQDRTSVRAINTLKPDETVLLRGRVTALRFVPIRRLKRPLLEAVLDDGTGRISLKWFNYPKGYFETKLKGAPEVLVYGQVKGYGGRVEILHPELEFQEESDATPGILPIYVEPEGLTQRFLRNVLDQAIAGAAHQLSDDIPQTILAKHGLMPIAKAIELVHRPRGADSAYIEKLRAFRTDEQRRLIFDDFFKFEWIVGRRRMNDRRESTTAYPRAGGEALLEKLKSRLPFALTTDQLTAISKIYDDLAGEKPMNRLLQGDVGCGKTLACLASTLPVIAGGGQAALMAPTEILAQQHLNTAKRVLPEVSVALLVGSTKKSERERILAGVNDGSIKILIGTHALIEPAVRFKQLGLVIIDEQHRFGVDQRMDLRKKGRTPPHILSMTATPIPRTLALTAYGDLDVTTIRQMPAGRPAITTRIARAEGRLAMFEHMKQQLKKGRQAYVIYPLVADSEKIDLESAVRGAEELANGPLSGFAIGLLHGRMKPAEKQEVMDRFKAGKVHVLVSTTVVEVGVDVPNATLLLIENAERFGLSQLHQLRGRIGRGTEESFCYLSPSAAGTNTEAYERLRAMEETRDGFKLAELDLKIRGPGEFLGTRQSGELSFPCADLVRDQEILIEARQAAFDLLKADPMLKDPAHACLARYMARRGSLSQQRLETA